MLFVLMTKLVVAVTKEVVRSKVPEPGSTVLTTLIDFVTAQQNATQSALERLEQKIDDIHQNSFRTGRRMLVDAQKISGSQLRKDRIQKALDAFTQASEYSQTSNPLVPLYARLSAGACYDLLKEGSVALDNYEEVFRRALELQKVAKKAIAAQANARAGPVSLGRLIGWLDKKPNDKKQKEFIEALVREKRQLDEFVEKLLTLITTRKGVSREEYLKRFEPKRRVVLDRGPVVKRVVKPGSTTGTQALRRGTLAARRQILQRRPLICATCQTAKTRAACPACKGTGKYGIHNCPRCFGLGSTYVCQCDEPFSPNPSSSVKSKYGRCLLCSGTGKVSYDLSFSLVKCPECAGTGFTKR